MSAFSGLDYVVPKRQRKEKKKEVEQDETSDLKKNQNMKTLADQKNGIQPLEKTAGS